MNSLQRWIPGTLLGLGALLCAGSASAQDVSATFVQLIHTSQFNPPSPDPAGLTYLSDTGTLLMTDSEVNEMSIFRNVNVFEVDSAGTLLDTGVTLPESSEPTGAAFDPVTGHVFISDDSARRIWEFDAGLDGRFGTNDDIVTSLFRTPDFGSKDPEGVAFDWVGRRMFVVEGSDNKVYRLEPGANGVFDAGDVTAVIDLAAFGVQDPEGGTFDEAHNTLLIADRRTSFVYEMTPDGELLRTIDIRHPELKRPASVTLAPSSSGSGVLNLWITDRATDNNSQANENDGKIFEFSYPSLGGVGNVPPTVAAQMVPSNPVIGEVVSLEGFASDDGLTAPLITTWQQVSGPATAFISDPLALVTTASFPVVGTYVLSLEADDGEFAPTDLVSVLVTDGSPVTSGSVEVRISTSLDDTEEESNGGVGATSGDLDFTDGRFIGLRFPNLDVPNGTTVTRAYVQFQVDEAHSVNTDIEIRAENSDHAGPLTTAHYDISSRPVTSAFEVWNVAPWTSVGEAGPLQQTPDLASIVQEVISRPGWSPGNALLLRMAGTGVRIADSFNGSSSGAPLLFVEFDANGEPPNQPPIVDAGAPQTLLLPVLNATLTGAASDDGLPDPPSGITLQWSQTGGPPGVTFTAPNAAVTEATFPAVGSYTLELLADDGDRVNTATTTVSVLDPSVTQFFETAVATGNDDAEQKTNGGMGLGSSDLELVVDKGRNQTVGMRFTNVSIPQGALVSAAWVQFVVDEVSVDPAELVVYGEAADDAAPFTSASFDITSRSATTQSANWLPAPWPSVGAADLEQQTPDLSLVIQEIVDRPLWTPGNALVVMLQGSGARIAESANGKAGAAPRLHVEFTSGP